MLSEAATTETTGDRELSSGNSGEVWLLDEKFKPLIEALSHCQLLFVDAARESERAMPPNV